MQATPTIPHSVIASNIERLLNEALGASRPEMIACREVTIVMGQAGISGGGNYVPDVAVLDDADLQAGASSTTTCHFAVEVVSPSDRRPIENASRPKIDVKVDGYRRLPSCKAVLVVDQGEVAVTLMVRTERGWLATDLRRPDAVVEVPDFGLRCTLSDIYARTPALRAAIASGRRL